MMLLLLASFAVKLLVFVLLYALDPGRIVAGDTASYENPARALATSGQFSTGLAESSRVETLRTPGYPAFLAGIFLVFGPSRSAVAVTQIAISTATVAVLFVLAARLANAGSALAAAAFLILDLLSFVYAPLLHTETLFTFTITVSALAGIAVLDTGRARWALLLGVALASATMIRPIAYYLFVPSLGVILLHLSLIHI